MKYRRIKYVSTCIALQEVPDEISLIINVSGCPHHCEDCHSQYLWEYKGNYLADDIDRIISEQGEYVTCICLMGGDYNIAELNEVLSYIKLRGYKTCAYLGCDSIPQELCVVDYLKIGSYKKEYGGLDKPTTNQRFYKRMKDQYINITEQFQIKEKLYAQNNKEP